MTATIVLDLVEQGVARLDSLVKITQSAANLVGTTAKL
jgi:hypothetical protein